MLINTVTFDEKRKAKRPPMAIARVAKKAGVSERTLARIKNNEEMNPSTVEKIAKALDTSIGELCAPPHARSGPKLGRIADMQTELAAARYNVSPELIEDLAPMLFVAVAELALKRRKERLETWWGKVEELRQIQPKFNTYSLSPLYNVELGAEPGISSLQDAYRDEMGQIEENSLDGWADNSYDHFFDALFSVCDGFEFEGWLSKETNPFVYGGYKYEGKFPEGSFPYPRESLKGFEGGLLQPEVFYDTMSDLAGTNVDFYDPLDEQPIHFRVHPIAKMAEEKLLLGYVPVSQMPMELRRKDKALERAEWIASYDGKEEIPEVFYRWESLRRIVELGYYEEEVLNLARQLDGASGDERSKIACELQAANEKVVAWKALIMPFDEEWYDKWKTYLAMGEEESEKVETEEGEAE